MNSKQRIRSIREAKTLDTSITGFPTFELSQLELNTDLDFQLPINLRLGHLVERIVSRLVNASSNYKLLYENLQIRNNEKTIGELDFIIQEYSSGQTLHVELAYKFYLYDPSISDQMINNWIGPNRKDSLIEKLVKLKRHQFPLLFMNNTRTRVKEIEIDKTEQALCLVALLFIPYKSEAKFNIEYKRNIKGYYLDVETFRALNHSGCKYCIPDKRAWGIEPATNKVWYNLDDMQQRIDSVLEEKQSLLCWRKEKETYTQFFVVWWSC